VIGVEPDAPHVLPRDVLSLRIPLWLALPIALAAPICAQVPSLPFTLDDPDAHWRLTPYERKLANGFEAVAAIASRNGAIRMVIFKSAGSQKSAEPLADYAERLRKIVVREPTANLRTATTKRIGYKGQLLSIDAPRVDGTYQCEIFAFAVGDDCWSLLQITPPGSKNASPFASLKKAAPVPAGAVALTPFRVQEDPVTSFPISLRVTRDNRQDHLDHIFVTDVPEGSITEQVGVKIGDEILRIDGRPVVEFSGGLGRRSELGKILIDRRPGSTVELALRSAGEKDTRNVTLIAGQLRDQLRRW
jgi:hypothetical protein